MRKTINGKDIIECSLSDIQEHMIRNADYQESEHFDYKGAFEIDLHSSKDNNENKKRENAIAEFRNDVCSFANTSGGYIIFGINEDNGIPCEIVGIDVKPNIDKFELNLKNYMSGIQPRMPTYRLNSIPLDNGKYVVIIYIKHDMFAPYTHIVDKNNYRLFRRHGNGKVSMTYTEVKNMFNSSLSLEREVKRFREGRLSHYISYSNDADRKFLLLHIIPDTFLDSSYNQPMFVIQKKQKSLQELFRDFGVANYCQPTIEGVRFTFPYTSQEGIVFNNGITELYYPIPVDLYNQPNLEKGFLNSEWILNYICRTITKYSALLKQAISIKNLYACVTLYGCKGTATEHLLSKYTFIDRDKLQIEPTVISTETSESIEHGIKLLKINYMLSLGITKHPSLIELIEEVYNT